MSTIFHIINTRLFFERLFSLCPKYDRLVHWPKNYDTFREDSCCLTFYLVFLLSTSPYLAQPDLHQSFRWKKEVLIHSSVSDMSLVQTFELTCVIVIMIPYHKFPSNGTKIQDSSTAQKKCGSWISTLDFCEPPPEEKRTGWRSKQELPCSVR